LLLSGRNFSLVFYIIINVNLKTICPVQKLIFLFIFLFYAITNTVYSQETGTIYGKVIDITNQQPVAGAVISIEKLNIKAGSDDDGNFTVKEIPVGIYSVKIASLGYKPLFLDNVIVTTGGMHSLKAGLMLTSTEEITVEAERFAMPLDLSTSFKSLSYEEIRRTPGGFEDIGRVVQTLPGVSFVNDGRNDLIVRGGAPSENLFLLDNSPIPNINHFGSQGSTGGPVSIINLDFINEINFITGGFSAKYGDKLSSVLEIKQREGNRMNMMTDLNLSATGFGAVVEGPFGSSKRGSWLLSARRSYLDFIFNAAGFGFVPEYSSFQAKATYDLNKNNFFTFNGVGNIDNVNFNNNTETQKQDNENILKNNQWGYVAAFELKSLLSPKSYTLLNLTRNYTSFDYSGRNAAFEETFKNRSYEGETGFKGEFNWLPDLSRQITFGGEGKIVSFRNEIMRDADTLYMIDPLTGQRQILPPVSFNNDDRSFKGALFFQITQKLFGFVRLNAGLRYDYFEYINDKNYISPRISASIAVLRNLNLNFSYGIFYQSPAYISIVSDPGNRNLKDIRADHYIAGLEYFPNKDTKASVEIYYKKYDNYPSSVYRPYLILANNGGDYQTSQTFVIEPLISCGNGYTKGVEFFFQKTLTSNIYGTVNVSLFRARYTALDGIERDGDYDNEALTTITGGYILGKGWEISSKFRFAGGRPYTPINPADGTQLVSEYNTGRLPNYYSLDVRAQKVWNFSKWTLITYVDIQNITGRKNISGYEWNKYTNKIEARESIGVLPTIGVNAMF
jgi:hypothetical protein